MKTAAYNQPAKCLRTADHVLASSRTWDRGTSRVLAYEPLPRHSCRLGCFCGFMELLITITHF